MYQMSQELGQRIQKARKRALLNQEQLAERTEVSRKTVGRYERGETEPDPPTLRRIAEAVSVSPEWLRDGTEPNGTAEPPASRYRVADHAPSDPDLVTIPEVTVEIDAGNGSDPSAFVAEDHVEEVSGELRLPAWYIRSEYGVAPERVRLIRTRGTSMTPTIFPGQRLLVALWDRSPVQDGLIYVLFGPGGLQIKRVQIEEEEAGGETHTYIWIRSDNPDFPSYRIRAERFESEYYIVAVALEINRKL